MKEFNQFKGPTFTRNFVHNKVKNLVAESWIARHTVEDECNFCRCNNLFEANIHKVCGDAEFSAIKLVTSQNLVDEKSFCTSLLYTVPFIS